MFRFLADGSIRRVRLRRVGLDEAAAIVEGRLPVTPLNLLDVLGSWPVYLERGRRGFTGALAGGGVQRWGAGRHLLVDRLGRGCWTASEW